MCLVLFSSFLICHVPHCGPLIMRHTSLLLSHWTEWARQTCESSQKKLRSFSNETHSDLLSFKFSGLAGFPWFSPKKRDSSQKGEGPFLVKLKDRSLAKASQVWRPKLWRYWRCRDMGMGQNPVPPVTLKSLLKSWRDLDQAKGRQPMKGSQLLGGHGTSART